MVNDRVFSLGSTPPSELSELAIAKQPQLDYLGMFFTHKHTCTTCGKTYKHKHHLKRHHDFECGVDPKFKCAFCPHRTRYKESLMKHILARHQQYLDQNSQYASYQQVFEGHAELDTPVQTQAPMYNPYPDFPQNL